MHQNRFFNLPASLSIPYFPIAVGIVHNDPKHRVNGNRYKEHIYNLHVVVKGKGWVHTPNVRIPIEAGSGFLYSEHQIQHYESDPDEPWDVWWVYFQGEGIRTILQEKILRAEPWIFPSMSGPVVLPTIRRLWELAELSNAADAPKASALLYQILLELLLHPAEDLTAGSAKLVHRLRLTADYMRANCGKALTLEQLAAHCGISSAYFSRTFHSVIGVPPLEYLASLRIELAKQMLLVTHKPIKQIALEVGYSHPSYFIERFRRHAGCTPAEYRSRLLQASDR